MLSIVAISLSYVSNKSPMALLVVIIMNSLVGSYLTYKASMEVWTAVLLLMVYVSGVMVLFMYVVSLSPMKMDKKNKSVAVTTMMILLISFLCVPNSISTKEEKSFYHSFEKNMSTLATVITMMVIMGSIIPSVSMVSFKGLKSSK